MRMCATPDTSSGCRVTKLSDHGGAPVGADRCREPVADGTREFSLRRFGRFISRHGRHRRCRSCDDQQRRGSQGSEQALESNSRHGYRSTQGRSVGRAARAYQGYLARCCSTHWKSVDGDGVAELQISAGSAARLCWVGQSCAARFLARFRRSGPRASGIGAFDGAGPTPLPELWADNGCLPTEKWSQPKSTRTALRRWLAGKCRLTKRNRAGATASGRLLAVSCLRR